MTYISHSSYSQELARQIRSNHATTLDRIEAVIHHPRSLARPNPDWRPPTRTLPRVDGGPQLNVTITRRRVGPRARARIKGFGERHVPAYLIEVRFTDASGITVDRDIAEAWVRALVPSSMAGAVHEVYSPTGATFVWLVDGTFAPVYSPPSMFEGLAAA